MDDDKNLQEKQKMEGEGETTASPRPSAESAPSPHSSVEADSVASDVESSTEAKSEEEKEIDEKAELVLMDNDYLIRQLEEITKRFEEPFSETEESEIGSESDHVWHPFLQQYTFKRQHASSIKSDRDSTPERSQADQRESVSMGREEEAELLVLDPDHDLMKRFQASFKTHLLKMMEKYNLETNTVQEALKKEKQERQFKGEVVYNVQQELARLQHRLECFHNTHHAIAEDRMIKQENVMSLRDMHKQIADAMNNLRKKFFQLNKDESLWNSAEYYLKQVKEDLQTDTGVVRRVTEKTTKEFLELQDEKRKQDLFIKQKMDQIFHLQEMLELLKSHSEIQEEELNEAKLTVAESQMQIECIDVEKKQVIQQWNSSLLQLQQREELYKTLQTASNELRDQQLQKEIEFSNLKKFINKAMQMNETLTMTVSRTKKLAVKASRKTENFLRQRQYLRDTYSFRSRMKDQIEGNLTIKLKEKDDLAHEKSKVQNFLEAIHREKQKLEDILAEKMLDYTNTVKADEYNKKKLDELRCSIRKSEALLTQLENELSNIIFCHTSATLECENLNQLLKEQSDEVEETNAEMKGLEKHIMRQNISITKKQVTINKLNYKIDRILNSADEEDSDIAVQNKISILEKAIEEKNAEIQANKSQWLTLQNELVRMTKQRGYLNTICNQLNHRFYIAQNKKIHTEATLQNQEKEIRRYECSINRLHRLIQSLNEKQAKGRDIHQSLIGDTILTENDLIMTLKETELEFIQLQSKLIATKEEKEATEKEIVELQRQILLWEKKIQLGKEAKALVSSDEMAGDIQNMKWEIHRMQVRYNHLKKQQELLVQETEKAVARRENIIFKTEAQTKANKSTLTKSVLQKKNEEMKRKISQTLENINSLDKSINDKKSELKTLGGTLEEKKTNMERVKEQVDNLHNCIAETERHYQQNFQELWIRQQKNKYYEALNNKKYVMACKTPEESESRLNKSVVTARTLRDIVHKLESEFPDYKNEFQDVLARHTGQINGLELPAHLLSELQL